MAQAERSAENMLQELVDRARRTETRVTQIANEMGIDPGTKRTAEIDLERKTISITNIKVSLSDILALMPADTRDGEYEIYCDGKYIVALAL